jgi:hypothetical protein
MSEHFCSLVAVETFGSGIPEHHLAVACFSDNGIIGRSDEGGQEWLSVQSIPTARSATEPTASLSTCRASY